MGGEFEAAVLNQVAHARHLRENRDAGNGMVAGVGDQAADLQGVERVGAAKACKVTEVGP